LIKRLDKILSFNKKEILLKAIYVFCIRIIGYFFGFGFTWVVASKFGAKAQGIFSIAFLFLSVGVMISKLGIETSIVKWIANNEAKKAQKFIYVKALGLVLFSATVVSIALFILAPLISKMYGKPDVLLSVRIAALGIPLLAILDVSSNFFKGRKQTTIFGLYFHFGKFLAPFLFICGYYLFASKNLYAPTLTYVIGLFVLAVAIRFHIYRLFKKVSPISQENFTWNFMLKESYPMLVASSIVMIMGWSDIFVLGFFVNESEIGIYSTAIKIATIVSFVYNAIATIATPKIAEYFEKSNLIKLNETISFSSRMMLVLTLPVFIILFIFPEFFLGIFGEEFKSGKDVLRILSFAQFTNVVTGPVGPVFQMTNNQKKLQSFIVLALICNIITSLCLVKSYNLIGVAIGSAIGMVLWNFLGAAYLFKRMKLKTWASF
jgi:O-antigen/teichoic acid export membrane protein